MKTWVALALLSIAGCKTNKNTGSSPEKGGASAFQPDFSPGPPTMVYKTRADYSRLVPVLLSDDGSRIVSYPDLSDIKTGTGFSFPQVLENGYLLDQRGIGRNVAFLNMTYEAYANLPTAPSPQELYTKILDKSPLIELCNCGNRNALGKDVSETLNDLIKRNELRKKCKVVK